VAVTAGTLLRHLVFESIVFSQPGLTGLKHDTADLFN
jgi:hypothetical protein